MLIEPLAAQKRPPRNHWLVALLLDVPPKLLLGVILAMSLALSIRNGLIAALGVSATLACFMVGSFAIHMWTRPGWRELCGVVACGGALGAVYARAFSGPQLSILTTCASFLGVSSIAVLAIRSIALRGAVRREKLFTLAAVCTLPFIWMFAVLCISMTPVFCPRTLDLYLYAFDSSLGFQPSFSIGRLFAEHRTLQQVCALAYAALPLDVSLLFGWHGVSRGRLPVNVLLLFLTTNVIGFLLYFFFPATGPVYVFPNDFPCDPPSLSNMSIQAVAVPEAPRNAMPSVHVAAALLVFWNSIVWPKWARALTGVFLLLTMLATLGFGEHYLVDLVVAAPFALALQAVWTSGLSWKSTARLNAFVGGSLAVAVWFVLLRIGAPVFRPSPAIAWAAVAVTVLPSLIAHHRLLVRSVPDTEPRP